MQPPLKGLMPRLFYQYPWPYSRPFLTHVSARDSWTFTGKSGSVSCGVTAPFSWVLVHTRFCALQESVSQVLWKFYNQIPLAFKVKFSGSSQSLCWIPRLGNLLCTLELSEQWENFFGIIVLQIVCLVALWWGPQAAPPWSAAVRAPVPAADPCWPVPPQETLKTLKGRSAQALVRSPSSGAHKVLFEPSEHLWQVWGLILNAILPLLPSCWGSPLPLDVGYIFWWGPTFSCWWLFSG